MVSPSNNKSFPLLKESLDSQAVQQLADCLSDIQPGFNHATFSKAANTGLNLLELKARVYHLIDVLHQHLPQDFDLAAQILCQVKQHQLAAKDPTIRAFTAWPLIDYVAVYGLQHPETALKTLAQLTSLFSAEFAIRPFIEQHYELTFEYLHNWCENEDFHQRRLASEGTRPRLPWGQQLPQFINDPQPILPLLEKLKADPEDYVRRSVANNLNDISKDHPQTVLDTCQRWLTESCKETQWVVRHATRTLVKKDVPEVFALLGYTAKPQLEIELTLDSNTLRVGDNLNIRIQLKSTEQKSQKLLVDYAIHFMKANGQQNAKVFKLKTLVLAEGETLTLKKTHRFVPLSTRRYHPGEHKVEVKINGLSFAQTTFNLVTPE
jgi:3-methyladenine DNA glycosylase AlkC